MTSPELPRVLDPDPVASLDGYVAVGGGAGLEAARRLGASAVLDEIEASGLRGRGGAGFPTGTKWRTVTGYAPGDVPITVVVNAAEGEPGTFKDRSIIRANPYRVIEGALIAALAVGGADRVVLALKASFATEIEALRRAITEIGEAGWTEGVVDLEIFEGPDEYLYGEETGLLEAINGRAPFPRIAPPYRHGADEIGFDKPSSASTLLAAKDDATEAPPTLVNNVESIANVPGIVGHGADWFRQVGTDESPGSAVFTVSGDVRHAGVGEFPLGTPLIEIVEALGGGPADGRRIAAVMSGVANPLVPADRLATPATYEHLEAIGSGLGACGFIVFDDATDPVAVAHGVARFLAVESCGQCTPCKGDGLEIATHLDTIRRSEGGEFELAAIGKRISTITEGARCYLAHQQEAVISSLLALFPDAFDAHVKGDRPASEPVLVAPITDLADGVATLDERHATKQPDWTYGDTWGGDWPAEQQDERAGTTSSP